MELPSQLMNLFYIHPLSQGEIPKYNFDKKANISLLKGDTDKVELKCDTFPEDMYTKNIRVPLHFGFDEIDNKLLELINHTKAEKIYSLYDDGITRQEQYKSVLVSSRWKNLNLKSALSKNVIYHHKAKEDEIIYFQDPLYTGVITSHYDFNCYYNDIALCGAFMMSKSTLNLGIVTSKFEDKIASIIMDEALE